MRRADREVNNIQKIEEIIQTCDCCHLGLIDEDKPYICLLYTSSKGTIWTNINFISC